MSLQTVIRKYEKNLYRQPYVAPIQDEWGKFVPQDPGPAVKFRGAVLPASGLFWERFAVGQLETGDLFLWVRKRFKLKEKDVVWVGAQLIDGQIRGGAEHQIKSQMITDEVGRGWGQFNMFILAQSGESVEEQ